MHASTIVCQKHYKKNRFWLECFPLPTDKRFEKGTRQKMLCETEALRLWNCSNYNTLSCTSSKFSLRTRCDVTSHMEKTQAARSVNCNNCSSKRSNYSDDSRKKQCKIRFDYLLQWYHPA